jgi:small basic protein (TIGR04137 family)
VRVTNPVRSKPGGGERFVTIHPTTYLTNAMSLHRSLRAASTSGAKRNVLKRFERVAVLKKRSQWKAGDRVTGLRKTKPDA